MTIAYKICGVDSNFTSCYGSINRYIDRGIRNGNTFDGIELYLTRDKKSSGIHQSPLFLDSVLTDTEMRKVLRIMRATGFSTYIPRTLSKLDKDGSIKFSKDTPFYVVVAVTSFFRLWANHSKGLEVYDMLRKRGLDAYQALAGMATLWPEDDGKWRFYAFGEHSIIPWTIFNEQSVAAFRDWHKYVGDLPSMEDELKSTERLSYSGRDEWFGAQSLGNDRYISDDDDEIVGADYGCDTLDFIKDGGYSEYETNYVDVDALVKHVKTWSK